MIIDIELHSSAPDRAPRLVRPAVEPGLDRADAPPARRHLAHRLPAARRPETPRRRCSPDAVQEFVQRHLEAIGEGHLPWKTVWTSVYRAGAMTLASYRHGRVLFAGNAAHAMPIFGVRGLNSGFDDADNLAWKLALVARGVSDASLLDSYSQERIAAFHINAESAMRSTEFMSPPSRGFDLLREAALSLSGAHREHREPDQSAPDAGGALRGLGAVQRERRTLRPARGPARRCPSSSWRPALHLTDWLGPGLHRARAQHRSHGRRARGRTRGRAGRPAAAAWCASCRRTPRTPRCSRPWARRTAPSTCCAPTATWPRAGAACRRARCAQALARAAALAREGIRMTHRSDPRRARPPLRRMRARHQRGRRASENRSSSRGSPCCCSSRSATRRAAGPRWRRRCATCPCRRCPRGSRCRA